MTDANQEVPQLTTTDDAFKTTPRACILPTESECVIEIEKGIGVGGKNMKVSQGLHIT